MTPVYYDCHLAKIGLEIERRGEGVRNIYYSKNTARIVYRKKERKYKV